MKKLHQLQKQQCGKLTLHSIHNVSKEDLESGETYISLMEKNLENLTKALK